MSDLLEQVWNPDEPILLISRSLSESEVDRLKRNYRDIAINGFDTAAYNSFSVSKQALRLSTDAIRYLHGPIQYPFSLIRLLCIELHVYTYGRLLINDKEYVFTGPPDNWGSFIWRTQVDEIKLADLIKASTKVLLRQS